MQALLVLLLCACAAASPLSSPPSNFQGSHACDPGVSVYAPSSLEEIPALVAEHASVKAAGWGGSWADAFSCPSPDAGAGGNATEGALTLVLTETEGARAARDGALASFAGPAPIAIDEAAQTATVEAGVPLGTLLDFLSNARSGASPAGWVLPSYPSGADTTFGGVIATGSHSSTTTLGSLSNQLVALTAVLANGTVAEFSEASDPHLFRAMQVSAGRLGVITSVTTKIKAQALVRRIKASRSLQDVLDSIQAAATAYGAAAGDVAAQQAALAPLDRLWVEWAVAEEGVTATQYVEAAAGEQGEDVLEERHAYPSYTVDGGTLFEGFEASVPLDQAAGCLQGVHGLIRGSGLADGFQKPATLRFVNEEPAYLAYTQGGPRVFVSLDDFFVGPAAGQAGAGKVPQVVRYMVEQCSGRLHFGKAGWSDPDLAASLSGSASFGTAWCHFGCAAQQLDPEGKFAGATDFWQWNATMGGAPADFASCCTAAGFDAQACQCV